MATQKRPMPDAEDAKAETGRTIEDIFDANYQVSAFDPPIGGGGGLVASVFGRNGTVVAVANDYTTGQINNTSAVSGADLDNALATILAGLLDSVIVVKQSNILTTIGGTIDSTKEYFIDGIINMGATQITVPVGGISIRGNSVDVSQLISSENNYTMFIDAGNSGGINISDIEIQVTGTSSQVFDLTSTTDLSILRFIDVTFRDCTSLGEITAYRAGLESDTVRFGGEPTLTLSGTWVGNYAISNSIVAILDAGMTTPIYSAGTAFVMNSRFRTNHNVDLPASASFLDFETANFQNPSALQLNGTIITRDGVFNATDANYTPNTSASDISSSWRDNQGISNTFEGGIVTVTSEVDTTINTLGVFENLAGVWTTSELQHFDEPSNGQLRNLGNDPREYRLTSDLTIDGTQNDDLTVRVNVWDDSASAFVPACTQTRIVNQLQGARNVAFFFILCHIVLDINDYVVLEVANGSGTDNVTAELDSFMLVEIR